MIRLTIAGASTHIGSTLCGACPQGVTGCCAAPPVVAWADLARIVLLGKQPARDWLLGEVAAGRLLPCGRGLALQRVANPDVATTGRERKCVYHGERGCTIDADLRSATCNYYVCDDALEGQGARARVLRDRLTDLYGRWDIELGERVRARFPDGPAWDAAFLDWLAEELRPQLEAVRL